MKLIEVITACIVIALGTVIGISVINPMMKINEQTRKIEAQVKQDKFICESMKKFCSGKKEIPFNLSAKEFEAQILQVWGLDFFKLSEKPEYYSASWSKNGKATVFYIKKEEL